MPPGHPRSRPRAISGYACAASRSHPRPARCLSSSASSLREGGEDDVLCTMPMRCASRAEAATHPQRDPPAPSSNSLGGTPPSRHYTYAPPPSHACEAPTAKTGPTTRPRAPFPRPRKKHDARRTARRPPRSAAHSKPMLNGERVPGSLVPAAHAHAHPPDAPSPNRAPRPSSAARCARPAHAAQIRSRSRAVDRARPQRVRARVPTPRCART